MLASKKIVGICGKSGSGKDHIAKVVKKTMEGAGYKPIVMSMALNPKARMIAEFAGAHTYTDLFHTKPERSRKAIQKYATDYFREKVDDEIWIKSIHVVLTYMIEQEYDFDSVIIPDIRFHNEAEFVLLGEVPSEMRRYLRNYYTRRLKTFGDKEGVTSEETLYRDVEVAYKRELTTSDNRLIMVYDSSDTKGLTGEVAKHQSENSFMQFSDLVDLSIDNSNHDKSENQIKQEILTLL